MQRPLAGEWEIGTAALERIVLRPVVGDVLTLAGLAGPVEVDDRRLPVKAARDVLRERFELVALDLGAGGRGRGSRGS